MAENKKKSENKSRSNSVTLAGYLRENNLEQIKDKNGNNVIRGSLTISNTEFNSVKVSFYSSEKTKNGEESSLYTSLSQILPFNTVTLASFLKDDETADFEKAKNSATRLCVIGSLEEYAIRNGEREDNYISIKGRRIIPIEGEAFTPRAEFNIEMYVNALTKELDAEEKETGRLVVEGLIPKWARDNAELVDKISFIAANDNKAADFIEKNYKVGDTVKLKGNIVNLREKILIDAGEPDETTFGDIAKPQFETKFVRERIITGGTKTGLEPITKDFVKKGLAAREVVMDKNGARDRNAATSKPAFDSGESLSSTDSADSDFDF